MVDFEPTGLKWTNQNFPRWREELNQALGLDLKLRTQLTETASLISNKYLQLNKTRLDGLRGELRRTAQEARASGTATRDALRESAKAARQTRSTAGPAARIPTIKPRDFQESIRVLGDLERATGRNRKVSDELTEAISRLRRGDTQNNASRRLTIQLLEKLQSSYRRTGINARDLASAQREIQRAQTRFSARQRLGLNANGGAIFSGATNRVINQTLSRSGRLQRRLDGLSQSFFSAGRAAGGYYTNVGRIGQGAAEITDALSGFIGNINATTVALVAGGVALTAFFALGARGAGASGIIEGFNNAGFAVERYEEASNRTIPTLELMRLQNIALTGTTGRLRRELGEQLPNILMIARVQARLTGQDVRFLFDSLVTGIKRSSPLLIDNTGLLVKRGTANEALAESLGKSTDELTAQENTLALLNAVLEAGEDAVNKYGDAAETNAEKLAQGRTSFTNFLDTAAESVQPLFGLVLDLVDDIISGIDDLADPFFQFVELVGDGATFFFEQIARIGGMPLFQKIREGIDTFLDIILNGIKETIGLVAFGFGALEGLVDATLGRIHDTLVDFFGSGENIGGAVVGGIQNADTSGVGDFAQGIKDFFPESPAKRGPLRNLDEQGRNIALEIVAGLLGADLQPVETVAQNIADALGPIATYTLGQIKDRIEELDEAVQPFIDQLDIVKARFEELAEPAEAARDAIDRQIDSLLQSIIEGDANAAAIARSFDQRRSLIQDQVDLQQGLVDSAAIQLATVQAQQGEERVLLAIRRRAFDESAQQAGSRDRAERTRRERMKRERAGAERAGAERELPTVADPELPDTAIPVDEQFVNTDALNEFLSLRAGQGFSALSGRAENNRFLQAYLDSQLGGPNFQLGADRVIAARTRERVLASGGRADDGFGIDGGPDIGAAILGAGALYGGGKAVGAGARLAGRGLRGAAGAIGGLGRQIIGAFGSPSTVKAAIGLGGEIGEAAIETIGSATGTAIELGGEIGEAAIETIGSATGTAIELGGEIGEAAIETISSSVGAGAEVIGELAEAGIEIGSSVASGFIGGLTQGALVGAGAGLGTFFGTLFGTGPLASAVEGLRMAVDRLEMAIASLDSTIIEPEFVTEGAEELEASIQLLLEDVRPDVEVNFIAPVDTDEMTLQGTVDSLLSDITAEIPIGLRLQKLIAGSAESGEITTIQSALDDLLVDVEPEITIALRLQRLISGDRESGEITTIQSALDDLVAGIEPEIPIGLRLHRLIAGSAESGEITTLQSAIDDLVAGIEPEIPIGLRLQRLIAGDSETGEITTLQQAIDDLVAGIEPSIPIGLRLQRLIVGSAESGEITTIQSALDELLSGIMPEIAIRLRLQRLVAGSAESGELITVQSALDDVLSGIMPEIPIGLRLQRLVAGSAESGEITTIQSALDDLVAGVEPEIPIGLRLQRLVAGSAESGELITVQSALDDVLSGIMPEIPIGLRLQRLVAGSAESGEITTVQAALDDLLVGIEPEVPISLRLQRLVAGSAESGEITTIQSALDDLVAGIEPSIPIRLRLQRLVAGSAESGEITTIQSALDDLVAGVEPEIPIGLRLQRLVAGSAESGELITVQSALDDVLSGIMPEIPIGLRLQRLVAGSAEAGELITVQSALDGLLKNVSVEIPIGLNTDGLDTGIQTIITDLPTNTTGLLDAVRTNIVDVFTSAIDFIINKVSPIGVADVYNLRGTLQGLTSNIPTWIGDLSPIVGASLRNPFVENLAAIDGLLKNVSVEIPIGLNTDGLDTGIQTIITDLPTNTTGLLDAVRTNIVDVFTSAIDFIINKVSPIGVADVYNLRGTLQGLTSNIPTWIGDLSPIVGASLRNPFVENLAAIDGLLKNVSVEIPIGLNTDGLDTGIQTIITDLPTNTTGLLDAVRTNIVDVFTSGDRLYHQQGFPYRRRRCLQLTWHVARLDEQHPDVDRRSVAHCRRFTSQSIC